MALIDSELARLTIHPSSTVNVRSSFLYKCLVFPKSVLKGNPEYFGLIHVKTEKQQKNTPFTKINMMLDEKW